MSDKMLLIATVLSIVTLSTSVPSFITPCKPGDSKCAQASATNAIPILANGVSELGAEKLDPVNFDEVDSSTPYMKFIMRGITITGLKECECTKLERDEPTTKIDLRLVCSIKLDGQYELTGNVIGLNVSGNGKIHTTLTSFINKCKWDDSKCIRDSTQAAIPVFVAGIPEFGVEKLDPLTLKSLDASSGGLKLLIKDVTATGLKDCIAKKVERDISKSKLSLKLLCTVDVVGKYEMKGKLLVLPIEGKGDAHVILRKVLISAEIDLADTVAKDGRKHWAIKDWTHSYTLKDKATINLDNLFNGNEDLGRAARELIESSSNELVTEIGPPIIKAVAKKIVENVKNLFKHVPVEDLEI